MKSVLNKNNITCVIPFYNEDAETIYQTVCTISKIPEVQNFVLIDDGSKSKKTYNHLCSLLLKKGNVRIARLKKNRGKSFAVKHSFRLGLNKNLLLVDADLKNVNEREISIAIRKFNTFNIDMVILRRVKASLLVKLIRADTLLSGERIIKKKHLINILKSDVNGYQLEVATNQYFIDKNLKHKCFWSPSSAVNNYKYKKLKFLKGIFKDLKMYVNLVKYIGVINFKNQISLFCKKQA